MPYRTLDDKIDGLVITLFNITDLKKLEEKLNEKENFRQIILNCSTNKIIRLSSNFKILEINPEAEKALEISHKEAFNQNFIHLFIPEQNQKKTEKELNKLMKENLDFKIKLEMLKFNQNTFELEWSVNLLKNHPETGTELIMIA
jgi:two-component system CheB/CheR fusion protein